MALIAVAVAVIPVVPGFINAATTEGGVIVNPNVLDRFYTDESASRSWSHLLFYYVLMYLAAPKRVTAAQSA